MLDAQGTGQTIGQTVQRDLAGSRLGALLTRYSPHGRAETFEQPRALARTE